MIPKAALGDVNFKRSFIIRVHIIQRSFALAQCGCQSDVKRPPLVGLQLSSAASTGIVDS